ncbi:MAG TPA: hypothetical protein PLK77_15690 [Pyrinomonadaceae bacterium]|nr:hypothetical protein [Pyrinomonadaceae bacterium]
MSAFGMDFAWQKTPATKDTSEGYHLRMSGEIRTGDSDRFREFVKNNLAKYKDHRYIV